MKRLVLTAVLLTAPFALAAAPAPTWAHAFGDTHPALHLQATYPDAQGQAQPLEFWRDASGRVVRRTGGHAELHLTPANDGEDLYQLRNLVNRTAYDVHRVNLYRVGVFTDRWSVQHLLDRPTGAYALTRLPQAGQTPVGRCTWWRISTGPKNSEVCWSAQYAVPLVLKSGGHTVLTVTRIGTQAAFPAATLPNGWQEYNADEDLAPD